MNICSVQGHRPQSRWRIINDKGGCFGGNFGEINGESSLGPGMESFEDEKIETD